LKLTRTSSLARLPPCTLYGMHNIVACQQQYTMNVCGHREPWGAILPAADTSYGSNTRSNQGGSECSKRPRLTARLANQACLVLQLLPTCCDETDPHTAVSTEGVVVPAACAACAGVTVWCAAAADSHPAVRPCGALQGHSTAAAAGCRATPSRCVEAVLL
jgi:hypothetical protein